MRWRRAAAAAVLGGLAACGSDDGRPVLRIAIWTSYMDPAVLEEFGRAHGCRVDASTSYSSNDELLALLEKGDSGFDLAVPSDAYLPAMVARGMLERIDRGALKNADRIDPMLGRRAGDPEGAWSVPYTWGTVGIAWRRDKVAKAPDSWHAFGDRSVGGGRAFLLEEARDAVAAALLAHGRDVNATDDASLALAKSTLLAWRGAIQGFTGETRHQLLSGDAWLLQAYNGDVAQAMAAQPGAFGFAVPKEGGILWVDTFVVPRGAPHRELAHRFVDHVLDPAVAARISTTIRYALANRDVAAHLPPEVRDDPVVYAPADVRARLHPYRDLGGDLKKVVDVFTEVRAD